MDLNRLTAISPVDGRYEGRCSALRPYLSEYALIRYRVLVEVRWLQWLAEQPAITELAPLEPPVKDVLNNLVEGFGVEDALKVKAIEAKTNHDVKAVEYFLRDALPAGADLQTLGAYLHFACTSEDINNLAYALMLRDARDRVLVPAAKALALELNKLAREHVSLAMMSRTHGQPATPTTLGKEIANPLARLNRQLDKLRKTEVMGKMNGAVGNFNAHCAAYPDADWEFISDHFVESLGLTPNRYTTQIEPHDWIAELCQSMSRYNTVLIDFCRDVWGYISVGYFKQRTVAGEVGSSTMPHKVNPIDFENAEGNAGMANAILGFLADKLPRSRWQRDLTDSTVLRSLGVGFAHSLIAIDSCRKGVGKLEADDDRIAADLDANWELLAEAIQTVMRKHGVTDAYEQLKDLTRGRRIDAATIRRFVNGLAIPETDKARLAALAPKDYVGLAAKLAGDALG